MKISAGLFILFLCTLANTSVYLSARPCSIRHSAKHSCPGWQALGQKKLQLQLRSGLANTFFAPQKCWRRFVVHLETWGRPSAPGCSMLDAGCWMQQLQLQSPSQKVWCLQQPLSVLGTRQAVASVGVFHCLNTDHQNFRRVYYVCAGIIP